jgi:hypothetical protein
MLGQVKAGTEQVFDADEGTRHGMNNLSFLKMGVLLEYEGRANLSDGTLISRFSARRDLSNHAEDVYFENR